jgi:hypothetical protein
MGGNGGGANDGAGIGVGTGTGTGICNDNVAATVGGGTFGAAVTIDGVTGPRAAGTPFAAPAFGGGAINSIPRCCGAAGGSGKSRGSKAFNDCRSGSCRETARR